MKALLNGREIVRVTYSKAMDRVRIIFDDRTIYVAPRRLLEGLELAGAQELKRIEIAGAEIAWPLLGVKHSVAKLLGGVYGGKRWMASLERAPRVLNKGGALFGTRQMRAGARLRRFFDEPVVMTNAQARRGAKRRESPIGWQRSEKGIGVS